MQKINYSYRLQEILKEFTGANYVYLFNSGRIALYVGLRKCLKPGSVIAVQAGVCRAVLWAIDKANMKYIEFINNIPKEADVLLMWKPQKLKTRLPCILDFAKHKFTPPNRSFLFGIISFNGKDKLIAGCGGGALFNMNLLNLPEIEASSRSLFSSLYTHYADKPIIKWINKIHWFLCYRTTAPEYEVEGISDFDAAMAYKNLMRRSK